MAARAGRCVQIETLQNSLLEFNTRFSMLSQILTEQRHSASPVVRAGAREALLGLLRRHQGLPFRVRREREQHLQLSALLDEAPGAVVRLDSSVELAVEHLLSWLG